VGQIKNAYKIVIRKPEGGDLVEDLGIDATIILTWNLKKWGRMV
jgi:hypothetical protein